MRPAFLNRPAPPEARPPRPLAPSAMEEAELEIFPPPAPGDRDAARRGILIHALLERLPPVTPSKRRDVADAWLAHSAGVDDAVKREELVDAALSLIEDPQFAELFGSDALAEAPISAVLPDGRVIAGTADRLLVKDDLVEVVDFKTGRRVPSNSDEIPAPHRAQMRAYIDALGVIFPDRSVSAALIYTAGPARIEVDA